MKTTNFEISKKLKEIGFKAEFNFHYKATDPVNLYWLHFETIDSGYEDWIERNTPSYDLETLIEALPKKITTKFKHFDTGEIYEFEETLKIYKSGISYSHNEDDIDWYRTHYGYYSTFDLSVNNSEGLKSLADTAGKLLIQLFEEGIVKFNK